MPREALVERLSTNCWVRRPHPSSNVTNRLAAAGCRVTAHDLQPFDAAEAARENVHTLQGDISDEASIASSLEQAVAHFGPVHILAANAGITDESSHPAIWDMPAETWDRTYRINVRGTFLTIKHFLQAARRAQHDAGRALPNLAIVVTGSECGKFGQAGHVDYASGKAALQYGLVRTVKNEMVRLNARARINAVAPGWVDTPLIGDRLHDPRELYVEGQATVPLRKIAQPEDVARAVAFLASHRAAGHMSGQVLSVDGGMEGRVVWREEEVGDETPASEIPRAPAPRPAGRVQIAWSIDFDAVSGWLGTGQHPKNTVADFSAGYFAAHVGVPRLLKVLQRLGLADKVTWCLPGHSMETFPAQTRAIAASRAEIALHGYAHEAAAQLSAAQERLVLRRCIDLVTALTGARPRGYRAPLYQLSERTIALLQAEAFDWDSSLTHHDAEPYLLPRDPAPLAIPAFHPDDDDDGADTVPWMHPSPDPAALPPSRLVEIPVNWYAEDMTPLQYFPQTANSHGYVDVRVVERMWRDRFAWLAREAADEGATKVFSIVVHPDTSGMAHVVGMVERFLEWLRGQRGVEFRTCGEIAREWRARREGGGSGTSG